MPFSVFIFRILAFLKYSLGDIEGRVGKGISAQASHGTLREALTSYGSYYPVSMTLPIALIPPILQWLIKTIGWII